MAEAGLNFEKLIKRVSAFMTHPVYIVARVDNPKDYCIIGVTRYQPGHEGRGADDLDDDDASDLSGGNIEKARKRREATNYIR